jgi:hippurate hydrolase
LINHHHAVDRVEAVTKEMFGPQRYFTMPAPIPGGEDYASILEEMPGAFIFLGAAYPGTKPEEREANHSNKAKYNEDVMADGSALLAALAFDALS